jgi:hypothetical protein
MKKNDLNIWLTKQGRSPFWQIRYVSPETGAVLQKSTGTAKKKEAERILGELRADLLARRYQPIANVSWKNFRERYEREAMPALAIKTQAKINTVLDSVETTLKPARLSDLTTQRLSYYQAKLREEDRAENTIAGYLAHLRSTLNWAVMMGMLPVLPRIQKAEKSQGLEGHEGTTNYPERIGEDA